MDKGRQFYPLEVTNGTRNDEEALEELRRKKKKKYITYGIAFVVFQTIVILIFSLTVMRVKGPKFRIRSYSITDLSTSDNTTAPSFSMRFDGQFRIKNTNFGRFKYGHGNVTFAYRGTPVRVVSITKGRARARSTKEIDVIIDMKSTSSELSKDIESGIIPLTSFSRLNGKVELMMVMKKKKSAQMNCTMEVVIATSSIQNLRCK